MKPLDFKESGRVQIDRSEIDRFWQHMEQYTSWTKHHGACTDRMVPLGLHGDDGQYNSAGDKLIVTTVNFLLEKETQQSFGRYPLVTLREFLCEGSMLETLRPRSRNPRLVFQLPLRRQTPEIELEQRSLQWTPQSWHPHCRPPFEIRGNHRCCLEQQC